jgi:hypothetical protein
VSNLGKEEKAIKDFKKAQALDPSAIVNEQIKLSHNPRNPNINTGYFKKEIDFSLATFA